jgi:hypothetical protein
VEGESTGISVGVLDLIAEGTAEGILEGVIEVGAFALATGAGDFDCWAGGLTEADSIRRIASRSEIPVMRFISATVFFFGLNYTNRRIVIFF